jgi:hypothetical protein
MPPQQAYGLQAPQAHQPPAPPLAYNPLERVPQFLPTENESVPKYIRTPAGIAPNPAFWGEHQPMQQPQPRDTLVDEGIVPPTFRFPAEPTLTASQKKRLRKKKAKERGSQSRPAPYPLQQDMNTNGHAPDFPAEIWPEPNPEASPQTECNREAIVRFYDPRTQKHVEHRLVCPLKPFPHPNQPHLLQVPSALDDGTEIFVGWWGKDE